MTASASPPPRSAAPAAALADRNSWLLAALGLGTGLPFGAAWYSLFRPVDTSIEQVLLLFLTSFGVVGLIELLAAPFLDRRKAPVFRALGHRRSWVAGALATALALTAVQVVAAMASPGLGAGFGTVFGVLVVPVMAILWIALDALRIELRPGRAQAAAFFAQYAGALAGAAVAGQIGGAGAASPLGPLSVVLLAIGLGAALLIAEPAQQPGAAAPAAGAFATLTRPWADFFARHGRSAKWLLAAIACYALGASVADYLGRNGYIADLVTADRSGADDIGAARQAMSSLELAFSLLGALAGAIVAGRFAPARAFAWLQYAVIALIALFVACRTALGFTPITVALLFALRTLVFAFGAVIYAVVAARLTARPHTAGQFALLGLFVALFWISDAGMNRLAPRAGSLPLALAAIGSICVAVLLMRMAARAARRSGGD